MANKKMIVNSEYPDGKIVDFSAEEEEEHVIHSKKSAEEDKIFRAEIEKLETDKASGNQKLKDLGLTDDEISALVG